MKKHIGWSHSPYVPPFYDAGDIYINRVVPHEFSIHFEWLGVKTEVSVYYRKRGCAEFVLAGKTSDSTFDITGLERETDYEFYVLSGEKKSRVRMAHTGICEGTAVNYLHSDDKAYDFSGRFLCSPCIVKHPDGYLLSSMDVYETGYPQTLTIIFRSDDGGETWHYVSELFPSFWGRMFIHKGELYMLSCSSEYSDLLIGRSSDGGKNFTEPVILLRGGNGKNSQAGIHKNPQPVVHFAGRIWNTLEWGSWGQGYHAPMVMSAGEDADLLDPASWSFSEPIKYDPTWEGLPKGPSTGNIEGTLTVINGKLYNVMRYDMHKLTPNYGKVIAYEVNTSDPEAPLKYAGCIDFPANHSKFEIQYDEKSGRYYSIASRILDAQNANSRNLLSLLCSEDCKNWRVVRDLIDKRDEDPLKIGFQYVDFLFDGDDIIFVCRTAMNGAANFHDSNYQTFHRIKDFRKL